MLLLVRCSRGSVRQIVCGRVVIMSSVNELISFAHPAVAQAQTLVCLQAALSLACIRVRRLLELLHSDWLLIPLLGMLLDNCGELSLILVWWHVVSRGIAVRSKTLKLLVNLRKMRLDQRLLLVGEGLLLKHQVSCGWKIELFGQGLRPEGGWHLVLLEEVNADVSLVDLCAADYAHLGVHDDIVGDG